MVPRAGRPGGLIQLFETVSFDAPALWPQYAPDYYALLFADPDGVKLEYVFGGREAKIEIKMRQRIFEFERSM